MKKVFKGYISPSEFEISGCPVKWFTPSWGKQMGRQLKIDNEYIWKKKGRKSDWEDGDYPPLEVEVIVNIKERKE
jgi:hypothetical protein